MRRVVYAYLVLAIVLVAVLMVPGAANDTTAQPVNIQQDAEMDTNHSAIFEPGFVRFQDRMSRPVPTYFDPLREDGP